MKTFNIYTHSSKSPIAVKIGFSWLAFIFPWLWMFTKRLWGIGFFILILDLIMIVISKVMSGVDIPYEYSQYVYYYNNISRLLFIAIHLIAGGKGNYWYELKLKKRGYTRSNTIEATSKKLAISQLL